MLDSKQLEYLRINADVKNTIYPEVLNLLNKLSNYKSVADINSELATLKSSLQPLVGKLEQIKNMNMTLELEKSKLVKSYQTLINELKARKEAEEQKLKEEERLRLEEQRRLQEEERLRIAEEKRLQELERLRIEDERKKQEQLRLQEELKRQEDQRVQDQLKLQEQLRLQQQEIARLQEQELLRLKEIEKLRLQEEERLRLAAEKAKEQVSPQVVLDTTPAQIVQEVKEPPKKGNAGLVIGAAALGLAAYLYTKD